MTGIVRLKPRFFKTNRRVHVATRFSPRQPATSN
ncbi:uncharacterized protein METZ01_LOCUS73308 [marine metagenome]|uniref:Uncharacterized protein n=1 Tax=marine metagenome TaxID=408172 RepID=A0A381TXC8_9ZZZZ